jgi:hypothetical protein
MVMKSKHFLLLPFLLIAALLFSSCQKSVESVVSAISNLGNDAELLPAKFIDNLTIGDSLVFQYDDKNRLSTIITYQASAKQPTFSKYYYDGEDNLVGEEDSTGNIIRKFTYSYAGNAVEMREGDEYVWDFVLSKAGHIVQTKNGTTIQAEYLFDVTGNKVGATYYYDEKISKDISKYDNKHCPTVNIKTAKFILDPISFSNINNVLTTTNEETTYHNNQKVITNVVYTYEYNSDNYPTRVISTLNGKPATDVSVIYIHTK